jgi:hypothetical protein
MWLAGLPNSNLGADRLPEKLTPDYPTLVSQNVSSNRNTTAHCCRTLYNPVQVKCAFFRHMPASQCFWQRPVPDGIFRLELIQPFPPRLADQVKAVINRDWGSFSKGISTSGRPWMVRNYLVRLTLQNLWQSRKLGTISQLKTVGNCKLRGR